jgi:gamma-butyrobetaine dioxygenase
MKTIEAVNSATPEKFMAFLVDLFHRGESLSYGRGQVSMCAHMLQTADLAASANASPSQIVASLLHDVGHFGTDFPIDFVDERHTAMQAAVNDHRHQEAGAVMLATFFGPEVSEPVRLHVAAKRYLCAVESGYLEGLGETTLHTLNLQGGPMSESEAKSFATLPFATDAAQLRRWDDQAMVVERIVPGFSHYQSLIQSLMH